MNAARRGLRHWSSRFIVLVATGVGAAAPLVALGDGRDGFWATHPMLAGLTSGVATLVFGTLLGIAVFDRVIEHRDTRRWKEVAELSCHVLGDELTRRIVTGLAALLSRRTSPLQPWQLRHGIKAAERQPLDEVRDVPPGLGDLACLARHTAADDRPGHGELIPKERLRLLLHEPDWIDLAIAHMRTLRRSARDNIAAWAAVMIGAEQPRQLLNAVALLSDELAYLRLALERLRHVLDGGDDDHDLDVIVDDCIRRWQLVDARARILTNELWRVAGEGHFSFAVPPALKNVAVEELFAEHTRIGSWAPPEAPVASLRMGRF